MQEKNSKKKKKKKTKHKTNGNFCQMKWQIYGQIEPNKKSEGDLNLI